MSKTIFFRVGDRNTITLPDLVTSLGSFMRLLRNFDSAISDKRSGSQNWEVTTITKSSPIICGVTPEPKPRMLDFSEEIETQLIESSLALTVRGERTRPMTDSALLDIKQIAGLAPRIGASKIFVPSNGHAQLETPINEYTMEVVNRLTGVRYQAYGSISGALEAVSVHGKKNEFRVWNEETRKVVRCLYSGREMEKKILDMLENRKKVYVSGIILSNNAGEPISVTAEYLEEKPQSKGEFNIRKMAGFIKDYTGGLRLKDYLREAEDE